jgi:hypothetical protein
MSFSRREFLVAGLSVAGLSVLPSCRTKGSSEWIVSACSAGQQANLVAAVDTQGQLISTVALPSRCHDALALPHKPGRALVFGRRPDTYFVEVDFTQSRIVQRINSQSDTHFYGHGVLSADGQYLYTTENRYRDAAGLIVVRDANTYQVLERFDSHGIGPHQLALMPGANTLVVANGGIATHPSQPRKKINLSSMQPNLAYLDSQTGKRIDKVTPRDHQLSLRHLSVSKQGNVFVGAQYQGDAARVQPLVFSHQLGDDLVPLSGQTHHWLGMQQYTASLLATEQHLWVTCPRGAQLYKWNLSGHHLPETMRIRDVSGLAQSKRRVFASTGNGKLKGLTTARNPPAVTDLPLRFDNHMTVIAAG